MRHHRFIHLFGKTRFEVPELEGAAGLGGFTVNPFAASVTPAQALIYQAAFEQAQQQQHAGDEEWPMADCWN
jgi:hypothetical protein